ncbi:uncharacterized protein J3R85_013677 [Psidium guajava]|nr:uncharacterized protein J3R85_013677 [Psidium guajava]
MTSQFPLFANPATESSSSCSVSHSQRNIRNSSFCLRVNSFGEAEFEKSSGFCFSTVADFKLELYLRRDSNHCRAF